MYFFTLEEFLEKYPFKVGDKVYIKVDPNANCLGSEKIYGVIESALWVEKFGYVVYKLKDYSGIFYREELHLYKEEESMEDNKLFSTVSNPVETKSYTVSLKDDKGIDNSIESTGFMQMGKTCGIIFNEANYEDEVELQLGDYEIEVRDGRTYAVRKKPKYPTTYEECCQHLGCDDKLNVGKLIPFQQLINARNAYWKIAGKEMGLDKPWEPNWTTFESMPAIFRFRYNIVCDYIKDYHCLLVFPTVEMRDAFYENFKELIEQCKELL